MEHPPKYQTPGTTSVAEGSGVTNSIPMMKEGAGELTPPGLVSYPGGPADVEYAMGAQFTAKGGSTNTVSMGPLTYKK